MTKTYMIEYTDSEGRLVSKELVESDLTGMKIQVTDPSKAEMIKAYLSQALESVLGKPDPDPQNYTSPDFRLFLDFDSTTSIEDIPFRVQYLPIPGEYEHPEYGTLSITKERAERFVDNFNNGVYQRQLPIDAEHQSKVSGALGWIQGLQLMENGSVDALIEWTERGLKFLKNKAFKYFSPEWYERWIDPATQEEFEDVAVGGALTTRPFFKDGVMRPVLASELIVKDGDVGDDDDDDLSPKGGTKMSETQEFTDLQELVETLQTEVQSLTDEKDTAEGKVDALEAAREVSETQLTQSVEEIRALQEEAQSRRFGEIVRGNGEQAPWYGDPEKHVGNLKKFATVYGEDSDDFKDFIKDQSAIAQQMAESKLLETAGSGAEGSSDVVDEIDKRVKALREAKPELSPEQAMTEVIESDPELYSLYLAEEV